MEWDRIDSTPIRKAFLLHEISARSRRTTPMSPELRSNDNEKGLVQKLDDMIEFINDYHNNNVRKSARSDTYRRLRQKHQNPRRIELPASLVKNLPASVLPTADEDTETQLMKLADTVRYQLIDNPEVLEKFRNKLKKKGDVNFKPVLVDNQSAAARAFSTVDKKEQYYHRKAEIHHSTDTFNVVLTLLANKSKLKNDDPELTNYQSNFDVDNDDIRVKFAAKGKRRTDDQNHVVPEKRYKTNEFCKEIGIKAKENENKAYVDKNKALIEDSSNTSTDSEENKGTVDSKNVRTRADSVNSKDNESENEENENENTDKDSPKQRSRKKTKRKHKSSKKVNKREHKKKNNRKHKEKKQSSISKNPSEDINENSHRFHKKRREEMKIEDNDIEFKRYKKHKHTESVEKDREVNVIDNQKDYKENVQDTMEIEWDKRHSELNKNENSENTENKYNFEQEWKEDYDFIKKDTNFNERDKKWIIRDKNWNKNGRIYVDEVMNQKFWDKKFEEQHNTGSDIENQDRWYLRNERDKIIENSNYNKEEIQL